MTESFGRREFLTKSAAAAGFTALGASLFGGEAQAAPAPKFFTSVLEHGAKGDGKSDDTEAFRKALKSLPGGGAVVVPRGNYVISGVIDLGVNQSLLGEPLGTRIHVKHYDAPAVRMPTESRASDLIFIYDENGDMLKPKESPETISMVGNGAAYIDNITFANAFIGVGTPKEGANCGQSVIRKLNGFVHDTMVRIDGGLDIIRIENVHCFVGGAGWDDPKAYFRTNRKCFHIKSSDGTLISKSFMIMGKVFLLKENGNHGPGLSTYLSECWLEGCSDYGIQINDGNRMSMVGVEMTSAYAKALVELNNGSYARMTSCYLRDSMNSVGVRVNPGSGLMMSDCEMHGTPGFTGIEINSSERSIITGNYIHHCEVGIRCSKDADNYLIANNQLSINNQPMVGAEGKKALVKDNL